MGKTTDNDQIPEKPQAPTDNGAVTNESLKSDYENGLPYRRGPLGNLIPTTDGSLMSCSPEEVAEYRNVDVYYVLKAVDPDWVPSPSSVTYAGDVEFYNKKHGLA